MHKLIRFALLGIILALTSSISTSYACCGTCGKESSCGDKDSKKKDKDSDQKE